MTTRYTVAQFEQPDSTVLDRVHRIQKACLASAVTLSIFPLLAWAFPTLCSWMPTGGIMPVSGAILSLACAASLATALASRGKRSGELAHVGLACLVVALAVAAATVGSTGGHPLADLFTLADRPAQPGAITVQVAASFASLGLVLLLIRAERGIASYTADALVFILFLLLFFLISRELFEASRIFGAAIPDSTRPATLAALALLSVATFLLRARRGTFDILMGSGLSSRVGRSLMILPIVAPFLREAGRARLLRAHVIPEHGAAAFLASVSAIMMLAVLVAIARYIRRMERSIRHLSLRDELTGLYNLRGFKLLAEQALRLAQRSNQPFSLLFIDVDDLKQINDNLGHSVGSSLLAETAQFLKGNFRESDVVGRIGGDEFAVAGQLTHTEIAEAAERLEAQAYLTRSKGSQTLPIGLSIGYVTATPDSSETLDELLEKADAAMYGKKRRKKLQLC